MDGAPVMLSKTRHYSTASFEHRPRSTPRPVSESIDALDLSSVSERSQLPSTLSALRLHVLTYLSDLETRLALLDFRSQSTATNPGPSPRLSPVGAEDDQDTTDDELAGDELDLNTEDVSHFVRHGFELLHTIRNEVCSHLPEYDSSSMTRIGAFPGRGREGGFRSRLGRLSLSHPKLQLLPELPHLPDMPDFARVPSLPSIAIGSLRSRLSEMSHYSMPESMHFSTPMSYVPHLQSRLSSLQEHMHSLHLNNPYASALPFSSRLNPPKVLSDLIKDLLEEDTPETIAADIRKAIQDDEAMHVQVDKALLRSADGDRLIHYDDLPIKWRNNEFIHSGYRFIPARRWLSLLLSIFQVHNETANIHTHFLPLLSIMPLLWAFSREYLLPPSITLLVDSRLPPTPYLFQQLPALLPTPRAPLDIVPASFFMLSAACCLLCSSIWHTCAGCASDLVAEVAARIDYIGIGWLISSTVQSIVYYGFGGSDSGPPPYTSVAQGGGGLLEQITPLRAYTALFISTGFLASVVPFQNWFNQRKNKKWRILFFLGLCFAVLVPLTHLSIVKGPVNTFIFVLPCIPSVTSYIAGLLFYAFHFPENYLPGKMDLFSSHAMWHIFIVLAIRSHYVALSVLKEQSPAFAKVVASWNTP